MRPSLSPAARRSLLAGGVAAAVLAYYVQFWARLGAVQQRGTDFSASWVAATVWRQGGALYDATLEQARHLALLGVHTTLPFVTPPLTAVLTAPLTLLPFAGAGRIGSLLELGLLAVAVAVAVRHAPWPPRTPSLVRGATVLAALAGLGTWGLLLQGQWDGVSALSLALAYAAWRRGHSGRAGAWLIGGALLVKPHLALGLAAWMLARRDRRTLPGAAVAGSAVVAASLVLAGPSACLAWLGTLVGTLTPTWPGPADFLGFSGLAGALTGRAAAAQLLALPATLLALWACWCLGDRTRRHPELLEPSLAGATVLSLVAAPHLLPHDLVLLAPAMTWTAAWAMSARPSQLTLLAAGWTVLNVVAYQVCNYGKAAVVAPGWVMPELLAAGGLVALHVCGVRLPRRRVALPAGVPVPADSAG